MRSAAFAAVNRAVESAAFTLVEQVFFDSLIRFDGFEEFEERVIGTTHSSFDIDETLHASIKAAFESHVSLLRWPEK